MPEKKKLEICSSQMLGIAQTGATFKNPNFYNLCEFRKIWKYNLRPTLEYSNFESIDENWEKPYLKLSLITVKNKRGPYIE